MTDQHHSDLDLLDDLCRRARKAGADAADALAVRQQSLSVGQRLGRTEHLEREEAADLGLRVFVGHRSAIVSGTDRSPQAIEALVERAVAMAKAAPEDPNSGLADPEQLIRDIPALELNDPREPSVEELVEKARTAEAAALDVDGVTNSEGGDASWGRVEVALAATNGFAGGYTRSRHSVSAAALAGEGTGMERDYDYSMAVFGGDLRGAEEVGRTAGERAVRRLKPRKVATRPMPVVLEQRLAGGLIGTIAGAINGGAIARGTSFLKDSMGQRILPPGTNIVDDPHLPRGLGSKPFDGEGLAAEKQFLVEDGVLKNWVLDLRTARQLGLASTGRAARGTSGPPSPSTTNLHLLPGAVTPQELISDIKEGVLVTELIGMGVSLVTGDYSRGAAGFWIENGEILYPVSEITIAGRLQDMLMALTAANDLVFRGAVNAPTLRIDGMTVAGT